MIQLKEDLDLKMYDYQKEIKMLEEKNKKLKDEGEKFKSRKIVELEPNFKTINSFSQLKEPSFI